ncbi:MAG: CHAT domain-containing protein, partial [Pseudomonadota bacterium]
HGRLVSARRMQPDQVLMRTHLDAARQIYQARSPDAVAHATVLYALADWHQRSGALASSVDALREALTVLDGQTRMLGGADDARALFADQTAPIYRALIEQLVETGNAREAFDVLERYRARSMLGLLAQREQSFAAAVDANASAQNAANRAYDRAQQRLNVALAEGASGEDVEALRAELIEYRALRESGSVRRERPGAPRADADPAARASLAEAQAALAPGTLALSYLVGDAQTLVFAFTNETFRVDTVALTRDELTEAVGRLRALIVSGRRDDRPSSALRDAGASLYNALLRPFVDAEGMGRLLLLPDGPLHHLPFAALTERDDDGERFVVERWPLRHALSLTLQSRAADCGPNPCDVRDGNLALFAAPGAGPERLAFAERELDAVERIAGGAVRRFDGQDATERRVLGVARDASILHFATHATLAPGLPLDSALELHPDPPQDNGRLQVWEIFEQLRTDAALVVLSACDSAQGMEAAGDGLISLSRAFHFAGAESVVATQWPVADRASAFFAESFYRGLRDGRPLDDALRAAQLALLRGEAPSSLLRRVLRRAEPVPAGSAAPYYWAGYQLSGRR